MLKRFYEHAGTLGIIGVLVGAFVGYPTCPVSEPSRLCITILGGAASEESLWECRSLISLLLAPCLRTNIPPELWALGVGLMGGVIGVLARRLVHAIPKP